MSGAAKSTLVRVGDFFFKWRDLLFPSLLLVLFLGFRPGAGLFGSQTLPQVVAILARRYRELELLAKSSTLDLAHLTKDVKVERGAAPDAGFAEETQPSRTGESTVFVTSIAAAREEAGVLFEMSRDLVTGLNLEATMQAVGKQIGRLVPHDTLAVYLRNGSALACESES